MCSKGCVLHHLACTAQGISCTGMEQVSTFVHGGVVEYCVSQDATPSLNVNVVRKSLKGFDQIPSLILLIFTFV